MMMLTMTINISIVFQAKDKPTSKTNTLGRHRTSDVTKTPDSLQAPLGEASGWRFQSVAKAPLGPKNTMPILTATLKHQSHTPSTLPRLNPKTRIRNSIFRTHLEIFIPWHPCTSTSLRPKGDVKTENATRSKI